MHLLKTAVRMVELMPEVAEQAAKRSCPARSVMIHLQPKSQNLQFGKRILHLVSETKVNTKMCTKGPMPYTLTDEQY